MAIRYNECFLVFILFLALSPFAASQLLCHHFLTAVMPGFESHGVLLTSQYTFAKNYYERFNATHYRVCICTKTACLRKCCPLGQSFINTTCKPGILDIDPEVYTENLTLIPNYGISNFYRVFGDTCQYKSFQLEPENNKWDEYFLLSNGTLVLPNDNATYTTESFCFENFLTVSNEFSPNKKIQRVFVCFPSDEPTSEKIYVYPIGMIISMPFLLATFIVYSLPELRNLHGKNLMSHVASLLTAYIVLAITQLGGRLLSDVTCIICGFITQYSFLATFFWLNVMCIDIWSTFSGFGKFGGHMKEKENKKFILYSLYAWGCPTIIFIVTVAIDYAPNVPDYIIKPNIGKIKCYFATKMATLAYFYAPMALIVLCDIILFALTAVKIYKVRRETKVLTSNESRRNDEASKQRYNLYLKLFMVMGINWAMELISWAFEGPKGLWFITDIMNSLQGLFIFWIFVCSKKIKKILKTKLCPKLASRDTETNTSSLKMSTSGISSNNVVSGDHIHMNTRFAGGRKTGNVSKIAL